MRVTFPFADLSIVATPARQQEAAASCESDGRIPRPPEGRANA